MAAKVVAEGKIIIAGQTITLNAWACTRLRKLIAHSSIYQNHRRESRMRENRLSGLEGGGAGDRPPPTPIGMLAPWTS